jgi:desulfoferrodoxin (superoxide reductase-like protein)
MKHVEKFILIAATLLLSSILVAPVFANEAKISIVAPVSVSPGTEITIKLNIMHHGNNWFHYTNWVYVKVNGEEVKRWEFSRKNRPESENFTRTFTYKVVGPIEVIAEANCNLHGNQGPAILSIDLK